MALTTRIRDEATGLDDLDPATTPAHDAKYFRAIVAAAEAASAAEDALRVRVREAREAGDSWTVIGAALGVTKQAAQQRFSRA